MATSTLLNRRGTSSEPKSINMESPQLSTHSTPRRPPPSSENSSLSLPLISTPDIDSSQSRGILRERPGQQSLLPPEKVFPIQIGSELFRLSGASLTSDGPSYFTRFFEDQIRQSEEDGGIKTLYIDRDPTIFRDIARHLQGYHIQPSNGTHYVRLFADAQFYSLPRLISQLFESETFIQIGDRHFQVPKDIFSSPGDSPNFFTLGFAAFFSSRQEVFPGLDRTGLLRPPSIAPPSVPSRSADVFAQLLSLLRGYPLHIRSEEHRAELLRDCRYFHLRGLEQKLIAHDISYNPDRQSSEILLRLEDVKPSGISFVRDTSNAKPSGPPASTGWVHYSRPFVDDTPRELVLEIGSDPAILNLSTNQATFHGLTKARIAALLQVVANKVDGPVTTSAEVTVKFTIDANTDLTLDNKVANATIGTKAPKAEDTTAPESKKRKLNDGFETEEVEWKIRSGQWRLRVQQEPVKGDVEVVLVAVKLDGFTCEKGRNARRKFLS